MNVLGGRNSNPARFMNHGDLILAIFLKTLNKVGPTF